MITILKLHWKQKTLSQMFLMVLKPHWKRTHALVFVFEIFYANCHTLLSLVVFLERLELDSKILFISRLVFGKDLKICHVQYKVDRCKFQMIMFNVLFFSCSFNNYRFLFSFNISFNIAIEDEDANTTLLEAKVDDDKQFDPKDTFSNFDDKDRLHLLHCQFK